MRIGMIVNSLKKDRIRIRRNTGWIPFEIYNELKKKQYCSKCNKRGKLEIHHKIPVSLGGESTRNNLIVVCSSCHKKIHKMEKVNVKNNK